jgi:nucleoside-diphosphate-sugar epimerase
MTVLRVGIVGGAGEVGSALLKALNADSRFSAFAICRNAVSATRIACKGMPVRIIQTDNAERLTETTRDLDVLVNCAYPRYQPSKASEANQRLANSLAVACAGKHLVHLSSVALYGEFIRGDKSLFDHPQPDTPYGRQKLQMENLLRALAKKHSMKCTILRVGHVYGPELRWSESIFDLIENDEFRLPFNGQIPSNGVWIQNLIAAIRELLLQPVEATLNLTDVPQSTWRDIFDLHSQASGNPAVPPLNQYESEQYLRESKKRARSGLAKRLASETWGWVRHLPASYIASVPAFKAMTLWAVSQIRSQKLDTKLVAIYSKRLAPTAGATALPEVFPLFLSEPVPGPCLSYQSSSPRRGLDDLAAWHHAISVPLGVSVANSVVRDSTRKLLLLNEGIAAGRESPHG